MEMVVLNGARPNDAKVDETSDVLQSALTPLGNVVVYKLRDVKVADCLGCFGCWIKTPGECIIDDAARGIVKKLIRSDLIIYVTPIIFGGYSYELKKVLDRQICRVLPFFTQINGEIHHGPRYEKYAKLLAIGVLPQPNADSETIFKTLVSRNAINMHAPSHSAEIVYVTDGPEVIREKAKRLLAGLEVKN